MVHEQTLLQEAMQENFITSTSQVKEGDIIYSVRFDKYLRVKRVYRWKLGFELNDKIIILPLKELQWKSYQDLKKENLKINGPE